MSYFSCKTWWYVCVYYVYYGSLGDIYINKSLFKNMSSTRYYSENVNTLSHGHAHYLITVLHLQHAILNVPVNQDSLNQEAVNQEAWNQEVWHSILRLSWTRGMTCVCNCIMGLSTFNLTSKQEAWEVGYSSEFVCARPSRFIRSSHLFVYMYTCVCMCVCVNIHGALVCTNRMLVHYTTTCIQQKYTKLVPAFLLPSCCLLASIFLYYLKTPNSLSWSWLKSCRAVQSMCSLMNQRGRREIKMR